MNRKRWTLGVVLAAAVSLWGLVEADASPFSSHILSDDIANTVSGSAAEQSDWADGSDTANGGGTTDGSGKDNNGHGNNDDGVDSSNKGQGKGGPNGGIDESCLEGGTCVDDESKTTTTKK